MQNTQMERNFGREMNATARWVLLAFDSYLRQVADLSALQAILMTMLHTAEEMTFEQVALETGALGDDRNLLLDPLFDKGYIRHADSSAGIEIRLSKLGEAALSQVEDAIHTAESQVLAGFTAEELMELGDYMKRIQANCRQALGK